MLDSKRDVRSTPSHYSPPYAASCRAGHRTDFTDLPRLQAVECLQDVAHERLQMHHTVRRASDDQDADAHCLQAPLLRQAPIHGHQDIEATAGSSKQFSIAGAGPADGLHRGGMMPRQFHDEIPGKVLVKQNAHCSGRSSGRCPAPQAPDRAKRRETDPGIVRASLRPRGSRTAWLPARGSRRRPACRRRRLDQRAQPESG